MENLENLELVENELIESETEVAEKEDEIASYANYIFCLPKNIIDNILQEGKEKMHEFVYLDKETRKQFFSDIIY
jgi:hypothetical protein